ncbi:MAG: enoyl-CoA hydratase [Candidatus Eremiobacteraeota bacterium]|nr:enoyl-CoA hydratase [Candidatus Eremiobacteraeota bacterium]
MKSELEPTERAQPAKDSVLVDIDAAVAYVTMNRPAKRNALSLAFMHELRDVFDALGADRRVGAVVLAANGPAYCSGHDLSEMLDRDMETYRGIFAACTALMEKIQSIPQPVIAQVHGIATAAGCQLVATCDLAVASQAARFATPGVKIGLFCSTPMVALSRAVGRKKAMEMLLTGQFISAREALEAGLVNRVVAADDLAAATRTLAESIVQASAAVVEIGKQAFYRQIDMPQPEAYDYTAEVMARNAAAAQAHEGIEAFLQKRPARWPS